MKRILGNLLLLVLSTGLAIIGAELILRYLGNQPWKNIASIQKEPTMHEFNAILGWRAKEGSYKVPSYSPGAAPIEMTFLKNGLRKSHEQQGNVVDRRPKIVFVGGSFTQGWAISDKETLAWKIQENFPSFEVLNYGTAGYGTYQSLLTLEQIMPFTKDPYLVVYGFVQGHELRNVAPYWWLEGLSKSSHRGHVFVPYVTMNGDDHLYRHQLERYPSWPLKEQLVVITKTENMFAKLRTFRREKQFRLVTNRLLLDMKNFSHENGAKFLVVILKARKEGKFSYGIFAQRNDIVIVNCAFPIGKGLKVKGEGHPNGKMHSKWAACITQFAQEHFLLNHENSFR